MFINFAAKIRTTEHLLDESLSSRKGKYPHKYVVFPYFRGLAEYNFARRVSICSPLTCKKPEQSRSIEYKLKNMKFIFCLLFAASVLCVSAQTGKAFPAFNIAANGLSLNNDSLKGKLVFINFWFAACPPCMAEMEALNEMYNLVKDSSDVRYISFSLDDPQTLNIVREHFAIPYTVYSLTREQSMELNPTRYYPTNMILDRTGKIIYVYSGGETNKKKARSFVMKEYYGRLMKELARISGEAERKG